MMTKEYVNWKQFAEELLWRNIVHDKNGDSYYDIITDIRYPDSARGHKVGDIGRFRILSYYVGDYKPLTWKELAIELGLFEDLLTPDGHDCKICPNRADCFSYIRGSEDHERCGWWMENMVDESAGTTGNPE